MRLSRFCLKWIAGSCRSYGKVFQTDLCKHLPQGAAASKGLPEISQQVSENRGHPGLRLFGGIQQAFQRGRFYGAIAQV